MYCTVCMPCMYDVRMPCMYDVRMPCMYDVRMPCMYAHTYDVIVAAGRRHLLIVSGMSPSRKSPPGHRHPVGGGSVLIRMTRVVTGGRGCLCVCVCVCVCVCHSAQRELSAICNNQVMTNGSHHWTLLTN